MDIPESGQILWKKALTYSAWSWVYKEAAFYGYDRRHLFGEICTTEAFRLGRQLIRKEVQVLFEENPIIVEERMIGNESDEDYLFRLYLGSPTGTVATLPNGRVYRIQYQPGFKKGARGTGYHLRGYDPQWRLIK
jgi:hypothetical protein